MQAYALGSRNQKILTCIIKLLESRRNLEILEFLMPTRGMLKIWENSDIRNIGIPTTRFWLELNKMQTHPERKKNIAREVIQNTNACKKRRNMAALPTGKHFDLTESQKELLKKLQEALVCCDPLTKFFFMVALPPPFASPAPTASISFFGCLLSINFFWLGSPSPRLSAVFSSRGFSVSSLVALPPPPLASLHPLPPGVLPMLFTNRPRG